MVADSMLAPCTESREVPAYVLDAIRAVASSGWEDMYDRECVMLLGASMGYEDAAAWLLDHRHLYFIGLRQSGWTAQVGAAYQN